MSEQEKMRKIREYLLKSGFPLEIEIGNLQEKSSDGGKEDVGKEEND